MAREYHNLAGLVRDLRAALERGHPLGDEFLDLISEGEDGDYENVAGGAGDGENGLYEPDGSSGADEATHQPRGVQQAADATATGMVRVASGGDHQRHLPLESPGGAGGRRAERRTAVLTKTAQPVHRVRKNTYGTD